MMERLRKSLVICLMAILKLCLMITIIFVVSLSFSAVAYATGESGSIITVNNFEELVTAIDGASNGDTIKLPEEMSFERRIVLTKSLTFEGSEQGSTLTYKKNENYTNPAFYETYAFQYYRHFYLQAAKDVTFKNCFFDSDYEGEGYGGGLYVAGKDNATCNASFIGCKFIGLYQTKGAAVWGTNNAGTFNLTFNDCIFEDNTVKEEGGGLYLNNVTTILENCSFARNKAYGKGAALATHAMAVSQDVSTTIRKCSFTDNIAYSQTTWTGAICFIQYANALIDNCTISNNIAQNSGVIMNSGAGIYARESKLTVQDTLLDGNTVMHGNGGAIGIFYMTMSPSCFRMINCIVKNNTASSRAGGLYLVSNTDGNIEVLGCTFENNQASTMYSIYYGALEGTEAQVTATLTDTTYKNYDDPIPIELPDDTIQPTEVDSLTWLWWTLGAFVVVLFFALAIMLVYKKRRLHTTATKEDTAVSIVGDITIDELLKSNISTIIDEYKLSQRESEVMICLVEGKNSKQIANELFISFDTARFHKKNIYRKLGIHSQTELIAFCHKYKNIES